MRKLFLLMGIALILVSSVSYAAVKVISTDTGTGFELTATKCKPVVIQPGSIFFETSAGREVLTGSPASSKSDKNNFDGDWNVKGGRKVTVNITLDASNYTMSLTASPDDDILKWGFSVKAGPDDYFTGVMERTIDGNQSESWRDKALSASVNMRGQMAEMLVKPTTAVYAPFYISSGGYGLFVKTTWPGAFNFCKYDPDSVIVNFEGPSLTTRFYLSNDLSAIVRAHAIEAGPPILPPKWAFSHWRWRDEHSNLDTYYDGTPVSAPYNSQVVEDMLMMKAYGIPCGVYWLDRPWATGRMGFDDFEWDTKRFPTPQKMVKWLGDQDTKLLLWIAPWAMGKMYDEALAKGYKLQGQTGGTKDRVKIDFTNPEATKWWQAGLKKVLDDGVAGFKLDRSEEITPNTRDIKCFDGRTTRELHSDYPHLYVKATYEIAKQVRGDDFVLMPRAAYTGSARYGVFWGGDVYSSELGLRASIIAVQKSAVMGYPYWGSDTGGYGGQNDHEVCQRWLAFSCFCPIMEVGPTEDRAFWDMTSAPSYDGRLIAVWRMYAKLHTDLMDYSYKHAQIAVKTGMPIVRPLFMVYPNQKQALNNWETYLYGSDILVSPIWKKGSLKKDVYLPAGEEWVDAWNKTKVYKGGQTVTVDAPLYKIPIFIRKGSKVDLGDLEALYTESLKIAAKRPNLAELQKTVK